MPDLDMPLSVRLDEWRRKALSNQLTPEEAREAIMLIRQGRLQAATSGSKSSRAGKSSAPINTDDLLEGMK